MALLQAGWLPIGSLSLHNSRNDIIRIRSEIPKQKDSYDNIYAKKTSNVYKNSPDYHQSYLKQVTDSS